MIITDKMIDDIIISWFGYYGVQAMVNYNLTVDNIKLNLKRKGYEVEEPKSKLDEARKYKLKKMNICDVSSMDEENKKHFLYVRYDEAHKKIELYEQYIKEILGGV